MRAEFITKRMSFCGWTGEKYKNHFGDGKKIRTPVVLISFDGASNEGSLGRLGIYVCSQCGYELFNSITKFKHDSPWPAFTETMHTDSVSKREESPRALKVSCGKCGNGLGHEFLGDGPDGKSRF